MKKTANLFIRFASLFLALLMMMSTGALLASAVEGVTYVQAYVTNRGVCVTDKPFNDEGDSMASRLYINGSFKSLKIGTATYHRTGVSVQVQLLKWDKNYETTIAGTPLYDERISNILDNQTLEIDLGQTYEAGEYLIMFKEAQGPSAWDLDGDGVAEDTYGYFTVLARNNNKKGLGCVYINGVEQMYDMYVQVGFIEEPAEPFKSVITFQDVKISELGEAITSDYYRFGPAVDLIGQRLNVSAPITGFAFGMPNWGNANCSVEMAVFAWKGNYEDTVAAEPLYKNKITGFPDNAANWLTFDEPLPAGEYLFAAMNGYNKNSNATCAVYYRDTNHSKGYCYVNGAELRNDLNFTVRFENKLTSVYSAFLDCEGVEDLSDGTVTLPEPYEYPADSLINTHKVQPTTWVFTDGLGRQSWQYGDEGVGELNEDKVIGMFYWTWQLRSSDSQQAFNLQQYIEKYPEAKNDYNHSGWDDSKLYYWNEPLYGYYSIDDPWVARRHAELLANAGVDTVFTDNSNSTYTFIDSYQNIFEQWTAAQELGVDAPKLTWYLPMWWKADGNTYEDIYSTEQIESIYLDVFKRGAYQNMWFWFDGKPLLIGNPDWFEDSTDPIHQEILQFFNFRKGVASYKDQEDRSDEGRAGSWGWLSKYPQATYYASERDARKGIVEQMSVGIAQNHDFESNQLTAMNGPYAMGRSYTIDNPTRYNDSQKNEVSETSKWGYNFAAQWEYAIEMDPKVVFVTGWNEWTVGRLSSWVGVTNAFADIFNDEFSRDIEPTKGALKDYYYYQMVNYSRKFKGAEAMPVPSHKTTIDLSAGQDQWAAVEPYYAAYIGNTMDRNYYGRV
ncbi:MAG: hypothetical protein IJX74_05295, partial [Clostridia bacterium]|nr:hypothetical protein [Clostridia bacterium]